MSVIVPEELIEKDLDDPCIICIEEIENIETAVKCNVCLKQICRPCSDKYVVRFGYRRCPNCRQPYTIELVIYGPLEETHRGVRRRRSRSPPPIQHQYVYVITYLSCCYGIGFAILQKNGVLTFYLGLLITCSLISLFCFCKINR